MAAKSVHAEAWEVARRQHWVVTGDQLRELGLTRSAIRHRVERGRLYPLWPNTYVVGRRELSLEGVCLAAVLTCGEGAVLSHHSAAALWGIVGRNGGAVDVSVPPGRRPRRYGIRLRRRQRAPDATVHKGIPVTTPAQTLLDIAAARTEAQLERAINEADKLDLLHSAQLRAAVDGRPGPGAKRIRDLLDAETFVLTDSELERRLLPIARRAGLPRPETQAVVNGVRVDFWWPSVPLIVETDGLRYHRTPTQQKHDRLRDQIHAAAGIPTLRFTHSQVVHDPHHVEATLRSVVERYSP